MISTSQKQITAALPRSEMTAAISEMFLQLRSKSTTAEICRKLQRFQLRLNRWNRCKYLFGALPYASQLEKKSVRRTDFPAETLRAFGSEML